jgi:hypothetical protein
VSPSPRCHVLYALLICGLVSATGRAADIAPSGGQGAQESDGNQKRVVAPGAANARRDPATWGEPLKGGDPVPRAAGPQAGAARGGLQSAVLHDARLPAPHRTFSSLRTATGNIAKSAIPAARVNLLRRFDAGHPASRLDPVTAGARGFGSASSGATGRQSSPSSVAASRPVASLRALASNGVVGGPRAADRGMVGGPATGKSMFKGGIDGTALRRRF